MKKIKIILLFCIFLFSNVDKKITYANDISKYGIVNVNSVLNVREGASLTSKIKTKLKNGSYLTIINEKNSFYYINYNINNYGYVSKKYVKELDVSTFNVNATSLNVRSGYGINYKVIDKLTKGEKVGVINTKNSFSKIIYKGGKIGYVYSLYLNSYGAKKLNVPSYKQFDTRWSNVKLGKSNDTIKKSGCLTTSIAMLESYKQKKNIYPDYIAKNYSYTSSGALYWPSNYAFSYSNYQNKMISLINENKPLIIGVKKANGATHFVVVTGYKNPNSTKLNNFYVNDPGSSYNDTLDDVFNNYPYFYKLAYYK